MQKFRLIPFPGNETPKIDITGGISRLANQLSIRYEVCGELDQILFPALAESPTRKDELWKATCFEFFIAIKDRPQYWEFNLSPSGDWNVYVMDAYRGIGFREETSIQRVQFEFQKEAGSVFVEASVDLNPIFIPDQDLEIGISAIIQIIGGDETYWALTHPGAHADFHLRDSFALILQDE